MYELVLNLIELFKISVEKCNYVNLHGRYALGYESFLNIFSS